MTIKRQQLPATKREIFGRKLKKIRREGRLPANIFGRKVKSQAITVDLSQFTKVYETAGQTGLIDIMVGDSKEPAACLISNVQLNPITDTPIHVDFHQVDLTEKVTAKVPVELVGESPAVKEKGADLISVIDEIEVEALPTDLPDKFTVDISSLIDFDNAITIKDLKVDRNKVAITAADEEIVVKVQEHKEEVIEVAPPPVEAAEGAALAEGAVPAEGEAKPEEGKSPEAPASEEKKQDK